MINIKTVFFGSPTNSYLDVMRLEFIAEEINGSEDLNIFIFSCIMFKIGQTYNKNLVVLKY